MNSFTLTAVGNLARNPEAVAKGDITYTRFCLVGNDYAGKDEEGAPREIVTTLWFVAFGPLAELLVHNTRKGDQLVVEARVRSNNWTDKQGEKQYDHEFVVQGFRYGAPGKIKRAERAARQDDVTRRADGGGGAHENGSAPVANGDASTANGHSNSGPSHSPGANGNINLTQSASGSGASGSGASGSSPSGSGASGASASASGASGSTGGGSEKPNASRAGRRAAAPPP
jgi:single-stranded DNA-binding protein